MNTKFVEMTKEWIDFDEKATYKNLLDYGTENSIVDLKLKNGDIVLMCKSLYYNKYFYNINTKHKNKLKYHEDRYRTIPFSDIAQIRITSESILRYKRHHWGENCCLGCGAPKKKPYPEFCSIIYPYKYESAYPDYSPRGRRPKITFDKKEEAYLYSY